MVSSFDELLAMIKEYPFDIVTMSDTWLKDNPLRLQYVTVPGYSQVFRNRDRFGAVALVLTWEMVSVTKGEPT